MFGIGCFKAQPTEFVRKVVGGRVKREGQALSFCQSLLAFNDLFVGRRPTSRPAITSRTGGAPRISLRAA